MAKSMLSYYVKDPQCAKWPLWFQLQCDAIHQAIYTKPKGQSTDETIDQIDFEKVAAENCKCGTGAAESGLLALSEADHTASSIDCKISAELTVPASLKQPSDMTLDVFACCPLAGSKKIVLYLHGGVYKFRSAASHHALVGQIANH
ncbi:hypothetical protein GGH19_003223, partial [Coemansia sp. RSA 1807]